MDEWIINKRNEILLGSEEYQSSDVSSSSSSSSSSNNPVEAPPRLQITSRSNPLPLSLQQTLPEEDKKAQCFICNQWYCRLNRHIREVHKVKPEDDGNSNSKYTDSIEEVKMTPSSSSSSSSSSNNNSSNSNNNSSNRIITSTTRLCSCHKVIEECGLLDQEYEAQARALQTFYYAIEIDPAVPLEEKVRVYKYINRVRVRVRRVRRAGRLRPSSSSVELLIVI